METKQRFFAPLGFAKNDVLTALALATACWLGLMCPATLRADYHKEKTLKLAPGGEFDLDASVGSVTLAGSSESGARIEITSNRDDLENLLDFGFEEGVGEVRVTARKKYHDWNWHNNIRVHFEVRVPTDTRVEIKTGGGSVRISSIKRDADLNTSGGSIEAADLGASLMAHTSGGSVRLERVAGRAEVNTSGGEIRGSSIGGRLEARTSGGSIELEKVRGDLLAHTSGGSIRIEDASGRVDAKTSGGSVEVTFAPGDDSGGDVETSGGGVRVSIDRSANLELDASASGGSVSSDLPVKVVGTISSSHLHGSIGSGGSMLRLHSDGGPIRIEAR
jgi:DUF4097 and DUF4098 domain-containing protein YvlB